VLLAGAPKAFLSATIPVPPPRRLHIEQPVYQDSRDDSTYRGKLDHGVPADDDLGQTCRTPFRRGAPTFFPATQHLARPGHPYKNLESLFTCAGKSWKRDAPEGDALQGTNGRASGLKPDHRAIKLTDPDRDPVHRREIVVRAADEEGEAGPRNAVLILAAETRNTTTWDVGDQPPEFLETQFKEDLFFRARDALAHPPAAWIGTRAEHLGSTQARGESRDVCRWYYDQGQGRV